MKKSSLLIAQNSVLHDTVMEALQDLGLPITEYRFAHECVVNADDETIIFYAVQTKDEAISVLKRASENAPSVPIVILTDNPAAEMESACWDNGAKSFFLTTELHLLKETLKRLYLIE